LSKSLTEAVFLGGKGSEVFAWIHRVSPSARRDIGVVVCSSFGREELCAHRTVMHLADAAAAEGLPAIRFDYHGTGDSAGNDLEPDRVRAWVRSVGDAIDALKASEGVSQVCLVGLRLGTPLAVLAAEGRNDVAGIVCLAPVVSGKAFMRELRLLAGTSAGPSTTGAAAGYMETGGFALSDQTQADIAAIDLMKSRVAPAVRLLVMDREEAPVAKRWAETCAGQGVHLDYELMSGYAAMMEGTNYNIIPHELILQVKRWLHGLASLFAPIPGVQAGMRDTPQKTTPGTPFAVPLRSVHEAAVAIDGAVSLAGIASIGDHPPSPSGTQESHGVILLSAGIARRIGPSRLYVDLARRWAADGHTVLRLDLSGIGDSPVHPDHPEQTVYAPTAAGEVLAAVNYLFARGGVTRCHIVGMCSGSYHGLKAALAGANLSSLVMINPLTFRWRADDVLTSQYAEHEVAFAAKTYTRLWREPEKWMRIVRGDFNPRQVARTLMQRFGMGIRSTAFDLARLLKIRVAGDLGAELESLAERGIRLRFVFSTNEPGISLLATQAGRSVGRLQRRGMLRQVTIPASDHIFTTIDARDRLTGVLTELLFGAEPAPQSRAGAQPIVRPVPAKPAA